MIVSIKMIYQIVMHLT